MLFLLIQLAIEEKVQIDINSVISIGLTIAVVGAAVKITSVLTELKTELRRVANELISNGTTIKATRATTRHIENHLLMFEEDVNNLFAAVRAVGSEDKLRELTRKSRFKPLDLEE